MKNVIILLNCLLLLLTGNSLKAQGDPNCGILVDGVLVDTLTSPNFEELSIIIPIRQMWKKYAFVDIGVFFVGTSDEKENLSKQTDGTYYSMKGPSMCFRLTPEVIEQFGDAKYAKLNLSAQIKETQNNFEDLYHYGYTLEWYKKSYFLDWYCSDTKVRYGMNSKPDEDNKPFFITVIHGHTLTEYKYDSNGARYPIYDNYSADGGLYMMGGRGDLLYELKRPYKLCSCSYDKKTYKSLMKKAEDERKHDTHYLMNCIECQNELSKKTLPVGLKISLTTEEVDAKGQIYKVTTISNTKTGNNPSSSSEVKTNTTESKTAVTKTIVVNTTTKPDPNLAPYVEKWPNGKIKVQGQKNKDDELHGTWKYYDENGKLIKTEEYRDNELISTKENQ